MPTLESLPHKVRQQLFIIAFNEVKTDDHQLNQNIRNCVRSYDKISRLRNWRPLRKLLDSKTQKPESFALAIQNLALFLMNVFMGFENDFFFVLGKTLDALEERIEQASKENKRANPSDWRNAVDELAKRAKLRGEHHSIFGMEFGARLYISGALEAILEDS